MVLPLAKISRYTVSQMEGLMFMPKSTPSNNSNKDESESLSDDNLDVHPGSGSSDKTDDDDTASLISSIAELSSGECKLGYYNRSTH